MYQYSRAIFLAVRDIVEPEDGTERGQAQRELLVACEQAVERLAADPRYFAHPALSLFSDIRRHFPIGQQARVLAVVDQVMMLATAQVQRELDRLGELDARCQAMTRKGRPCQRTPLSRVGYCPSHLHLARRPSRLAS
jgi:hypothetical protein